MKFNKSSGPSAQAGQASKLLLVLAVVVLVAVIIVYLVMRMVEKPPAPPPDPTLNPIVLPFYEKTLGDIRFVFESALDKGNVLGASEIVNNQYGYSGQKDLPISNTGAKFVKVTIGAQNVGTQNTEQNAWNIYNVIDSQGRQFVPLEGYTVTPWLPNPNECGALLKPAFDPTPCTKIYEVSKESIGFKIEVKTGLDNKANNLSSGKVELFLIDLIVK